METSVEFRDMNLQKFSLLEKDSFKPPGRTKLYVVPPLGKGTIYAESLTSYIKRLADAHSVSVTLLLHNIVIPDNQSHIKHMHPYWRTAMHSVNGSSSMAEQFVSMFEVEILSKLVGMTLLPLEDIVGRSGRGTLHKNMNICPLCINQMAQHRSVFIPLIWWLEAVSCCPIHKTKLIDTCPACSAKLTAVPNYTPLGYCPKCGAFLGEKNLKINNYEKTAQQEEIVQVASELILYLERRTFFRNLFLKGVKQAVDKFSRGNIADFEEASGFPKTRVKQWLSGKNHPRLDDLIKLCVCHHISLVALCSGIITNMENVVVHTNIQDLLFAEGACDR